MTQSAQATSFKSLGVWLRLLVMLITGGVVYHLVDWKNVWQGLSDLTATTLVLGVGVCVGRSGLQGWRWKWLNSDRAGSFSIWNYVVYILSGNTFNLVMPGGLGGDFVRSVLVYKH
ncbi:MAG: flippase-like domain-containing protein, partial [Deltaproteobacteria bacterium]|nr:flippase-like domain-containing protein [Deltaproteobacteria bacterium]